MSSTELPELLKVAAQRGYLEDVKTGATPNIINATDDLGNTLLHIASGAGHTAVVEFLLSKKDQIKLSINKQNHIGDIPLHKASFRGFDDIVQLLIKNGSDSTIKNKDGKTAMDLARSTEMKQLFPQSKEEEILIEEDDD